MKRMIAIGIALMLLLNSSMVFAQENRPPEAPDGSMGEAPPEKPNGEPPTGMTPPDGAPGGGPGGGPGGPSSAPEEYAAVYTINEDMAITEDIVSTGTDENAVHVAAGTAEIQGVTVTRSSGDSTGGDAASFYGVGAAILATGGSAELSNVTVTTDANGGAGAFAYGEGIVTLSDSTITTQKDTSGGIHVAGGGTLYANNVTVTTQGESSAAIRSDRGGGTMVVSGGSYTSNGVGSPAVYVTADISIQDAALAATGSEALCLEGKNNVRLVNCSLSGNMADLSQNDNTWTVILYQSMSGDAEVGEGRFEMDGGALRSQNGGLFYTTNTKSEFVLRQVEISSAADREYFLRCTGNSNQRGWGQTGANGAQCVFTGICQTMEGDVIWDSISQLSLYATEGSLLVGAVVDDETHAGNGGDGFCNLYLSQDSTWVVTGDSVLSGLYCAGTIQDGEGNSVTIVSADGSVLVSGASPYTVTVHEYSTECDLSGQGTLQKEAME